MTNKTYVCLGVLCGIEVWDLKYWKYMEVSYFGKYIKAGMRTILLKWQKHIAVRKCEKEYWKNLYLIWYMSWRQDTDDLDLLKYAFFSAELKRRLEYVNKKRRKNKWLNFIIKAIFVVSIIIFTYVYLRIMIENWNNNHIITGVEFTERITIFLIAMGLCGALSKWLDIKKYQETWARHARHMGLLEIEMYRYIYAVAPYDSSDSPNIFIKNFLEIEMINTTNFANNMENKEKPLMDIWNQINSFQKK